MADRNDALSSLPWPAILSVLTAVGGVFLLIPPLTSERPAIPQGPPSKVVGYQDVDARLWQDPFQALDASRLQSPPTNDDPAHTLGAIRRKIAQKRRAPQVLAVMIPGLPYAEYAEARLRTRLAVISGLGRARFEPEDNEHIGFFTVNWSQELSQGAFPEWFQVLRWNFGWLYSDEFKIDVPYEWWEPGSERTAQKDNPPEVLVLWLREELFTDKPFARLTLLMSQLRTAWPQNGKDSWPQVTLIGPAWSSTLHSMVIEANQTAMSPTVRTAMHHVDVISPSATASESLLMLGIKHPPTKKEFPHWMCQHAGLHSFRRTIATDSEVCKSLVAELELRDIDVCSDNDCVALIAEWDTLYGRWLPITFAASATGKHPEDLIRDLSKWPTNIYRFSYLSGIDGRLPGDDISKKQPDTPPDVSSDATKTANLQPLPHQSLEETEGRNQTDALRRLANDIAELDRYKRDNGEGGIKAVGVLAGDVYDKLLILKALRRQLPDAVFFTTDLDARFYHPSDLDDTHNLIVASPYGPQLDHGPSNIEPIRTAHGLQLQPDALQGDIPPFRDDYQTSTFLATLLALRVTDADMALERFKEPRMFEIARSGPFDVNRSALEGDIHGRTLEGFSWLEGITSIKVVGLLVACSIPYWLFCYYHKPRRLSLLPSRNWPTRGRWIVWTVLIVGTVFVLIVSWGSGPNGEPWALDQGISIWPTEAIRLIAICCAGCFLIDMRLRLHRNERRLCREFCLLSPLPKIPSIKWRDTLKLLFKSPWKEEALVAKWQAGKWSRKKTVIAKRIWRKYLWLGDFKRRTIRVVWLLFLYFTFVWALTKAFGWNPHPPARGATSRIVDVALMFLSAIALFLVNFYVGDAAKLCSRLAYNLGAGETKWPGKLTARVAAARQMDPRHIGEYLDVRLLAERTKAIMPLIYYPFVILLLLIFARNKYFANWDWPPILIFVFVAHLSYALYQYVLLRSTAERVRQAAVISLQRLILKNRHTKPQLARLEAMVDEIKSIRDAAFASPLRNPIVGALLVPLAGLACWIIFQYVAQPA